MPNLQKEEFQNDYYPSEILKFMPEKSNFQSQAFKPTLERQKARQYDNLQIAPFFDNLLDQGICLCLNTECKEGI